MPPLLPPDTPLRLNRDAACVTVIERGEFCYRRGDDGRPRWLHFWPHNSIAPLSAAIAPQKNGVGCGWTLSGSEEAPTLFPSVDARGVWHGFLTDGVARGE